MVSKLPSMIPPPKPGPAETVNEIPTSTDYYDGSSKLNVIKVTCNIYANKLDCLRSSHCGWCGSTSSCVLGNNLGPLQKCVRSTYIFSAPSPNFNPHGRVINENVGGIGLTVISK